MTRRILLLITDLERGGTPTVVRELAVRLSAPNVHIEVGCLSRWGPVADDLAAAKIPVNALEARGPADWRVLPRLVRLLREGQFDTVFSFLVHANAVAAMASLVRHRVRWIQSVQTTQPNPRWHWRVQRWAAGVAEKVVVPSTGVAGAAHNWAGVPVEKIIVIPNVVDAAGLQNPRPVALQNPPPDPYPITFLGRLDPIKNVPTLVAAMALVGPGVCLHVYGDGPDRARVERQVQSSGVADRVVLHGSVARPLAALRGSGALVLPSSAEGFGLVLIEAMAAGVPVIASDIPGIRDVVTHDSTGLLTPVGDVTALAAAVRETANDPDLRRRSVLNGLAAVRERFTWDVALPQYRRMLGIPG